MIDIPKKDWNGYKLHDFLQYELTNNPELDEFHALIYMRLIWITNRAGWNDNINVPTDHTANQSRCSTKTYRTKLHDLERFGMIRIINKSKNQYTAAEITLKTEKLQKTLVAMYLTGSNRNQKRDNSSLPGRANGQGKASAWEPRGQGIYPHIKKRGCLKRGSLFFVCNCWKKEKSPKALLLCKVLNLHCVHFKNSL